MIKGQQQFVVSAYQGLYDIIIPKDNFLRKLNALVDFSFIYDELLENYNVNMGRGAKDPIMLFKYLILKTTYELSDEDVVSRTLYDMSFKYFLNLAPEEVNLIHPSTLTKFRKLRLKDMNLLDLLIKKTVEIAIAKGVLVSKTLIVDATHTKARYNQKSAQEVLLERAKSLRKEIYKINSGMKEKFPQKVTNDKLEEIIEYCRGLVNVVESTPELAVYDNVKQRLNYLNEAIEDDLEHLALSTDEDARIGHKTQDSSFFGYKTHIAMSEERIITGAVVTTGEKADGKELQGLVEKSQAAGMAVEEIIGDAAYSEKGNLTYAKENQIIMISKLNPIISCGTRKKEDEFQFNKDAGMFVCPAGHMSIRKARQRKKGQGTNQSATYYFDIKKCKSCFQRDGCYKEGSKSKTYSVAIKSEVHKDQMAFQETEYFKARARERYKIEAKNSELKHQHGYNAALSSGLIGMQMQGALTIFTVNIKRIIKLLT
ncbi:IS1182 family transposase [Clostridium sp. 19966]|uniref:IS1182 family transposase n=1 Tax=Clostridium sp. 19966 TaxID=2768166 RepID=UPI0028DE872B|nr:IS1182 family transposase [Clostridium sp. 19966]MDT8719759.1 IS1182 family transposase [Clostridium sp. 19966]